MTRAGEAGDRAEAQGVWEGAAPAWPRQWGGTRVWGGAAGLADLGWAGTKEVAGLPPGFLARNEIIS